MSTTSSGRFDRICGVDGIFRLNYKTHGIKVPGSRFRVEISRSGRQWIRLFMCDEAGGKFVP
jgi:hypothetical protein